MADMEYSVLMSVYYREKASNLQMAMQSIWKQTVPTDDFVLVCDGPLNEELDTVIAKMQSVHPELHVIRSEKNEGLGNALNKGMKHCKHELIARMDSDDISINTRIEKQLNVFASDSAVSICSGEIEEFAESQENIIARRVLPERHEDIISFAKKRNPFNHPCVMYKKQAVDNAGGYQDFYLLEDYYLWVRMLNQGCIGYNVQEPLLLMRAGDALYSRRGGSSYAKSVRKLFSFMLSIGFITRRQYYSAVVSRSAAAIAPNWLRKKVYLKLLREKGNG